MRDKDPALEMIRASRALGPSPLEPITRFPVVGQDRARVRT